MNKSRKREERDEIQRKGEPEASMWMLKRPDLWPSWPYLPVKKPGKTFEKGGTAVVIEATIDGGRLLIARDANLFAMTQAVVGESVPATAEEIIEEGWRVD